MYTKFIIKLYPFVSDGVWGSAVDITEAYDVNVSLALGEKKDVFSFKINNNNNYWITGTKQSTELDSPINVMDKVDIHYSINGASAASSNLLISGIIKKCPVTISDKGKVISIEGVNLSEVATQALVFYDAPNNQDVMTFLRNCLNSVTLRNPNFTVSWNSGNPTLSTTYTGLREFDKSLGTILDKYLQDAWTNNGRYYWFINNSNELVIRKREISDNNGTLTQGSSFKTAKINYNADDVKNFIVVKCGLDPNNKPITTRADNPISRAKYGFRYYMLIDNKISGDLIDANKASFPVNSKFPSSYPYTTSWGTVVNDDSEWVEAFRIEAKRIGENKGHDMINITSQGRINVVLTMIPTLDFSLGNVYYLVLPSYGLNNFKMRVKEVDYDLDGVLLTLEEDITA